MAVKERIKIFELDIDVDAAIAANSKLKSNLEEQRAELKKLKDAGDTTSETYVELDASVKSLSSQYNDAQRQIGKMLDLQGKEIKTVKEGENALAVINKEWAKQTKLYGANSKEADALAKKHAELKERTRELRMSIGDTSTNIGNYTEGMKKAIEQTSWYGKAQKVVNTVMMVAGPVIKYVKNEVREMSVAYKAGMVQARGFSGAQKAAAIGTNLVSTALKLFKIALISTGIGAIIVLIGSLVAWFSKTQKGIDLVNKVMAAMGAAFDVIIDRVSKFGGAIVKFFSGDLSGAFDDMADSVKGLGDELAREIALAYKLEEQLQKLTRQETLLEFRRSAANTTLKELNKTVEDLTKSEEERLAAAREIEKIETELADAELKNAQAQLNNKLGKLEADQESIALLEQLKEGTVEYDELLKNIGLSESTDEDVRELLDLFKKAEEAQTRSFEVRTTNQNKLNTILQQIAREEEQRAKEALQRRQKAIDEAIKEQKTRLDLFIEQNEVEAKSLQESLRINEEVRDKRLALLQSEFEAGKKTKTEYELEKLKITKQFLSENESAEAKYADTLKESFQEREDAFANTMQLELIELKKRMAAGQITEEQYADALERINLEALEKKLELAKDVEQEILNDQSLTAEQRVELLDEAQAKILETEQQVLDAKIQMQQREREEIKQTSKERLDYALKDSAEILKTLQDLNGISKSLSAARLQDISEESEGRLSALESEKQRALDIANGNSEEEERIEREFNERKVKLEKERNKEIAKEQRKQAIRDRVAATFSVILETGTAVAKSISASPLTLGLPWSAFATAQGALQIAAINSAPLPKAEKGAIFDIGGKRHSSGGTKFYGEDGTAFEAEQGEVLAVLNRNAAMAFNGLNRMFPAGVNRAGNYFATGGIVQRSLVSGTSGSGSGSISAPIDYELLAVSIAEANMSLPNPVTDVKDIIQGVSNYNSVVNGANI